MKKLAIVFAVGAAALMGGSAYAADNAVTSKHSTDAAQSRIARNRGLLRNPRPTSAHNTAGTGAGIIIGVAITTGTTAITGRTTGAITITPRVRTVTRARTATMAADPA